MWLWVCIFVVWIFTVCFFFFVCLFVFFSLFIDCVQCVHTVTLHVSCMTDGRPLWRPWEKERGRESDAFLVGICSKIGICIAPLLPPCWFIIKSASVYSQSSSRETLTNHHHFCALKKNLLLHSIDIHFQSTTITYYQLFKSTLKTIAI